MSWFDTLIGFQGFDDGFWLAALLTAIVLGAGWAVQRLGRNSMGVVGLTGPAWVLASVVVVGGFWGYEGTDELPSMLLWGLVVLFVAGELAERTPNPKVIGIVLALPGALVVGFATQFPGPGWVRPLVIGTVAVGGPLAADFDRRAGRVGVAPFLWLLTVAGLYWTVPDTERVRPLIGAAVPLAVTGWPGRTSRMGGGGICAAIGLYMWVAGFEGRGRPGSIVGAAAALGLFVAEPLGRALTRRRWQPLSQAVSLSVFALSVVGAHFVVVAYASRVVGFADTGQDAVVWLVPMLPVAIGVGGWLRVSKRLGRRVRRRRRTTRPARPAGTPGASSITRG